MSALAKLSLLRRRLAEQAGLTVVEMMVVVTILGILSAVSVTLVTVIMDANLRTSQNMAQQTTITNTYGYLSSRLASAKPSEIGYRRSGSDKAVPLSVAGDQLMFSSTNGGGGASVAAPSTCYRLMYFKTLQQIRVATARSACSSSSAAGLEPVRGPNENVGTGEDPRFFVEPDDPRFDPAIDSAYPEIAARCEGSGQTPSWCDFRSWILADGVTNNFPLDEATNQQVKALLPQAIRNSQLPVAKSSEGSDQQYLSPFSYLGASGNGVAFQVDPEADSASTLADIDVNLIGSIQLRALVSPFTDANAYGEELNNLPSVAERWNKTRYWGQSFSLSQVCAIPSGSSGTVGAGSLDRFKAYSFSVSDYELPYDQAVPLVPFNENSDGAGLIQVETPGRYLLVAGMAPSPESLLSLNGSQLSSSYQGQINFLKADNQQEIGILDDQGVEEIVETAKGPVIQGEGVNIEIAGWQRIPSLTGQLSSVVYLSRTDVLAVTAGYMIAPDERQVTLPAEPVAEGQPTPDPVVLTTEPLPPLDAEQAKVYMNLRMYWIGK